MSARATHSMAENECAHDDHGKSVLLVVQSHESSDKSAYARVRIHYPVLYTSTIQTVLFNSSCSYKLLPHGQDTGAVRTRESGSQKVQRKAGVYLHVLFLLTRRRPM